VKPKTSRNRRGGSGEGKTGRVNAHEPLRRPRDPQVTGIDGFYGDDGSTTVSAYGHDALRPPERSQDGHQRPRGKEGTQPSRVSQQRNVTTPSGSDTRR
jgi:hypothetical protein